MKLNENKIDSHDSANIMTTQTLRETLQTPVANYNCQKNYQQNKQYERDMRKNKMCRICLQYQKNEKNQEKDKQQDLNILIQMPCSCKGGLGKVHQKCLKYWIKIWLQQKIKSRSQQNNQRANDRNFRNRAREQNLLQNRNIRINHQYNNNNQTQINNLSINLSKSNQQGQIKQKQSENKINQPVFRPLDIQNLKQNTIYPFPCQVCQDPIYFDLIFHRRIKNCQKITKKQVILFFFISFFTFFFLGICANWFVKSGVSLPAILFYVLFWVPLFLITIVIGVGVFTNHEFWVKGIYSINEVYRRQHLKRVAMQKYSNQTKKIQQKKLNTAITPINFNFKEQKIKKQINSLEINQKFQNKIQKKQTQLKKVANQQLQPSIEIYLQEQNDKQNVQTINQIQIKTEQEKKIQKIIIN